MMGTKFPSISSIAAKTINDFGMIGHKAGICRDTRGKVGPHLEQDPKLLTATGIRAA